jgi:hypothetical protein
MPTTATALFTYLLSISEITPREHHIIQQWAGYHWTLV